MKKSQENPDLMKPRIGGSKHQGGSIAPSVKVVAIPKSVRQAAFKVKCSSLSSGEAVACARLIPDANPSSFKVVRVSG